MYLVKIEGENRFVYKCNICDNLIEKRLKCSDCPDYTLCVECYGKLGHEHKMTVVGHNLNAKEEKMEDEEQPQDLTKPRRRLNLPRREIYEKGISFIVHSSNCKSTSCREPGCIYMKNIISHAIHCPKKLRGGCLICKRLIFLCVYHGHHCTLSSDRCPMKTCLSVKRYLRDRAFLSLS